MKSIIEIEGREPSVRGASVGLHGLVRLLVANHTPEELAIGYLRYEAVRKMSPRTFVELHKLNLSGKFFDSLVDEALKSWKQPNDDLSELV